MEEFRKKSPMLRRMEREMLHERVIDLAVETGALILLVCGLFVVWSFLSSN